MKKVFSFLVLFSFSLFETVCCDVVTLGRGKVA